MAEQKKRTKRPTAEKRLIQAKKRCLINKTFKSRIRTGVRRFEETLKAGDKEAVDSALRQAHSLFDRAVKRGIYKVNKASRAKSRLAARAVSAS